MNNEWINPAIFSLGPLQVRWYGVMYILGFVVGTTILKYLAKKKFWPLPSGAIDKYITWLIGGMFIGARFFYVVIYNWEYYSINLLDIFAIWKGGLSFHGAVIGMCLATWFFAKKNHVHFFQLSDSMAIAGSPGLLFGRLGNFINGELYGRITDSWAGIIFPAGGPFPRHPSQLYEGFLEGFVLFLILFFLHRRVKFYGVVSAAFLLGYGSFRFFVEFFREPDSQLGYYLGYFTMGQILCFVMIVAAYFVYLYAKKLHLRNPLSQPHRG